MGLVTGVASTLLYAPGAFFFYPHKPLLQWGFGDSYATGYSYFRRDHSKPSNLALHCVALCWQLLGNFGLLHAIDAPAFGLARPLSALTALCWSGLLLGSAAPLKVSGLSSGAILLAYLVAPGLTPRVLEMAGMGVFVLLLMMIRLAARGPRLAQLVLEDLVALARSFGLALAARLVASQWHGVLAHATGLINPLLAVLMLLLGALPKPVVPVVIGGALVVRPMAELTGQDALLFYGAAFVAQVSQGVAHDATKQKATLISHEQSGESREVRLAFEWSHVVYFPCLLIQSCFESLGNSATSS